MNNLMRIAAVAVLAVFCATAEAEAFTLESTPRRNLEVQVRGASRTWEVYPVRLADRFDNSLPRASEQDLRQHIERWERTGQPRRYDNSNWQRAFQEYLGGAGPEGARFYFYARNPSRPIGDFINEVEGSNMFWVSANRVEVVGFPRTWVDIFVGYVNQFSGAERQAAVGEWEEAHREIILNDDADRDWFSPEERNEFARFYQAQFVYIRNENPRLPSIYEELAEFHHSRGNLDAELSTYLAALRAGVESPYRERFALEVGSIFVLRLQLFGPALQYLRIAENHSEARYLMVRCLVNLGRYEEARRELSEFLALLEQQPDDFIVGDEPDEELGRALVALAELEFRRGNFGAAATAVERIPAGNPYHDAGRVQLAAIYLNRNRARVANEPADVARAREIVRNLSLWPEALTHMRRTAEEDFPLDPLIARALVIYAQTEEQFTGARPGSPSNPRGEVLTQLRTARALDPLSAEPYLAEGRLMRRLGRFREALSTFQEGLDVNPQHPLLHYHVADLHAKAGLFAIAKDHLQICLNYEPDFAPALTLLGEIAISDVERVRRTLLVRISAGDEIDFAGELVPVMKEAAAFFTASLEAAGDQPAVRLSLGSLYLQLAEVAPDAVSDPAVAEQVRIAYLTKARDFGRELVEALEEFAESNRPQRTLSERETASVPSLAAFNVYAYAQYELGHHDEALGLFTQHITRSADRAYFASPAHHSEYQNSSNLAYARTWHRRITENRRQYYDIEDFSVPSEGTYYGRWEVAREPRPDTGFQAATRILGGQLEFGINQQEPGVVSRLEHDQPHETLARFEAQFENVGRHGWVRGIHLTKYRRSGGDSARMPQGSIMLGIDTDGRVFWESRAFTPGDQAEQERTRTRGYIDPERFGGRPIDAEATVRLGLQRQLSDGASHVEYVAIINGHRIVLDGIERNDGMSRIDFQGRDLDLTCGFFAWAMRGVERQAVISEARYIFDTGLNPRR
jgi:tetratricopeptide (TPR) repeat protein